METGKRQAKKSFAILLLILLISGICGTVEAREIYAGGSEPNIVYQYLGTSWETISPDLGGAVLCLCEYDGHLYAGTGAISGAIGRVWRYDGGTEWTRVGDNLDNQVCSLIVFRGNLYAGTAGNGGKLYRYDGDGNWPNVVNFPLWSGFRSMYVWNDLLYIGDIGVDYIGHYDGNSFTEDVNNLGGSCIWDFEGYDGYLYASAFGGRVHRSSDGHTWETIRDYQNYESWELEAFQGHLYVTTGPNLERYDGTNFSPVWTETNGYEIISMINAGDALILGTGKEAGSQYGESGIGKIYTYDGSTIHLISGNMGNGIQSLHVQDELVLTKVDDVDDDGCVGPGDEINYRIGYNYPGGPNLPDIGDVNIIDELPIEVNFNDASDGGVYDSNSRTVTWDLDTLSPGESGYVMLKVIVKPCVEQGGTIRNKCEIKSGDLVLGIADENTPVCFYRPRITKIDNIPIYVVPGGNITYSICYDANGYGYTNVEINDVLPDEVEFISATGNYEHNAGTVTWHISTLGPNESGCVTLTVKVKEGIGCDAIRNCCEMTGDCITGAVTACEDTPVCADPCMIKLDINYTHDNNDANTQVGFTPFILANSGSEVNGVVIDLGGNLQDKRETDPCGQYSGGVYYPRAGERIYRDFIYGVQPSGVTITLWGLGANRQCNVTMWAYDACSTGDANRVANWYSNGTYIFDTNFIGGPASWPRYEAQYPQDLYKYAFSGTATTDNLGRIILTSLRDPYSPSREPFAFVNALVVVPMGNFVPTKYAQRPVPFDDAENMPVNVVLKWRNGAGVVKHDLYLGDDEDAVANATRVSHPGVRIYASDLAADANKGYDPCGATGFLELDKTYYWRVDENDNPPVYKGEVWSFTTSLCAVVDNFNSYADTSALKAVWKDYWSNGTCAEVFLAADPNRGGPPYQSMEYDFKNYEYWPYYSEATATIGTGADKLNVDPNWLGMGAKALVLWFYGHAGNDANQPMYVKLTDGDGVSGTVEYDGDMNDIRETLWHEWNIDLQKFVDANNVNLAKVAKITIGFGDRTQKTTDGIVYFEDITLCATRCVLAKRSPDLAKADYAPPGNPGGDCVVDYQELEIMANTWLAEDDFIPTKNPGDANLVVYYPLNEGDGNKVYPDPCDPCHTGTFSPSGVTWATPGAPGIGGTGCIYINGDPGSRVQCGTYGQAGLRIGPTPPEVNAMTLSIWAKWLGPRTWDPYLMAKSQGLIGKRSEGEGSSENGMIWTFWISAGDAGSFGLGHYSAGDTATPDLVSPSNILNPYIGQWVHLAATFPHPSGSPADGNSYAWLYLNGGQVADGPWRFSHGADPNIFLTIGNTMDQNAWADSPESFYGYIDEVRIYNHALEPNEIAYMADTTPGDRGLYVPVPSPAEVYSVEEQGSKVINFKDFAILANYWLEEELWP